MPIYEYQCPSCRRVFEAFRSMAQANETAPCPNCGTASPRVPSAFGCKVGSYVKPASSALRSGSQ